MSGTPSVSIPPNRHCEKKISSLHQLSKCTSGRILFEFTWYTQAALNSSAHSKITIDVTCCCQRSCGEDPSDEAAAYKIVIPLEMIQKRGNNRYIPNCSACIVFRQPRINAISTCCQTCGRFPNTASRPQEHRSWDTTGGSTELGKPRRPIRMLSTW
jgi:hypothetical protein